MVNDLQVPYVLSLDPYLQQFYLEAALGSSQNGPICIWTVLWVFKKIIWSGFWVSQIFSGSYSVLNLELIALAEAVKEYGVYTAINIYNIQMQ